jgi:20S proteasome alpha/beta subunit
VLLKPSHPPFPKPRRLLKEVAVTVALGLSGEDGIVICCDSQETISGYIKLDNRKMHLSLMAPNRALAIAGAGTTDYIDTVAERISRNFPVTESMPEVRNFLEETLLDFFDKNLARWASFSEQERPSVELLIVVSLKEKVELFHYVGTILHQVDSKAIGAGVLLANDLIRQNYSRTDRCEGLAKTAIYVLRKVKKSVDTCGGFTDLVAMSSNGHVAILSTPEIEALENIYVQIEKDSVTKLLADIQGQTLPRLNWYNRESLIASNKNLSGGK